MKLKSNSPSSEIKRLRSRLFALLARVGHQKRKALAYQEEAEHYYSIATEALAGLAELLEFMEILGESNPRVKELLSDHVSRQHQLVREMLGFWPRNTDSQERALSLLDSDGLVNLLEDTGEGYWSLSSDQILRNVERSIEASMEQPPKP